MKLIYICTGIPSVFDSQVLSLLNYFAETSKFSKITLLLGYRNQSEKKALLEKEFHVRVDVKMFYCYPNYIVFNWLTRLSLHRTIKKGKINPRDTVFHIRGEIIAYHLIMLLTNSKSQPKVLCDIRGVSDEIYEFGDYGVFRRYLKTRNYEMALKYICKSTLVSVVSNSLKNYLLDKYQCSEKKTNVTPCLASTEFSFSQANRDSIRKDLGVTHDDVLVVYSSGGDAEWQNGESILNLADSGIKILNLSRKNFHHKSIINKFVDYTDVPKYLSAADYGYIWREESVTNKVASPVKFSEYVCCGLPVLSNYNVDVISEFITNTENSGYLFTDIKHVEVGKLKQLQPSDRITLSKLAQSIYGIDVIASKYFAIYDQFTTRGHH